MIFSGLKDISFGPKPGDSEKDIAENLDPFDIPHISYTDPYDLNRFVFAQDNYVDYSKVLEELRRGKKRSHWMWFVFPTLVKEPSSMMSRHYAIRSEQEAKAYLDCEILRSRLDEAVDILNSLGKKKPLKIFGHIDSEKLFESMTLFHRIDPANKGYRSVLEGYYENSLNERIIRDLENPSYKYCPVAASFGDIFIPEEASKTGLDETEK